MPEGVWQENDDNISYERDIAEKEWDRLQQDHGNASTGYKVGIVEGKEVNMQRGFDRGYKEGLAIGKQVGKLCARVSTQITFYQELVKNKEAAKELEELFGEIDAVEVNDIYSVDYFRKDGPQNENYISPSDYVNKLEIKINAQLQTVSEKYDT